MKSRIIYLMFMLCAAHIGFAQLGTGLINDPKQKGLFKEKYASDLGYGEKVPSSYSMRAFTPYVKSQGQYGTCTAWAAAYSAYSTAYAMQIGLTDRNLITALAFCPYYVYNKVNGDNSCSNGTTLEDVLSFMIDDGVKRFYLPVIGCGTSIPASMDADASQHKIKDAFILYDPPSYPDDNSAEAVSKFLLTKQKPDINKIKATIAAGNPVVFGGYVANSFMGISNSDVWEASNEEKADPGKAVLDNTGMHQQHAMCIIGYDDNKYGGSFEVINSWSELWGSDGYIWIPYNDWALFNYKAFWLDLGPNLETLANSGCVEGDCENGYGIYKFESGERYEGHHKNGKRNGYGIYTWPSGIAYGGEWVDNKRNGEAVVYLANGNYGTCTYQDDEQVGGYGDWTYGNGDTYDGSLTANYSRNGYGTYTFADGRYYTGSHLDGKFSGLGKMVWTNGDMYIGEWLDNERNGFGIYIAANGKIKAGDWSFGELKTGQNYGYANGRTTEIASNFGGLFSAINYATADCLSGDCLNGKGSKKYSSGLIYNGEFKDALEHGYGTWVFTDGSKQTGYFEQGKPNGVFKAMFTDGGIMIGDYANGLVDGYSIYIYPSKNIVVEYYQKGKKIRDIAPSADTMNMQLTPEKFGDNPRVELKINDSK